MPPEPPTDSQSALLEAQNRSTTVDDREEIDARTQTTPQQEALINRRMQRLTKEPRT